MGTTTKKQHYVWRGYLKRWNEEFDSLGRIYVYRKSVKGNQPRLENARLQNVGFEKYYYDMTGFSKVDVELVSKLIMNMQEKNGLAFGINEDLLESANEKRDFMEGLICKYEGIDNEYQFLEKISQGDMSFYKDMTAQKVMNELEKEIFNAVLGIEGKNLAEIIRDFTEAIQSLDKVDMKHEFHRFFFLQYMRSPIIHKNQTDAFNNMKAKMKSLDGLNTDFYVNSLMIFITEQIAWNISRHFLTWIERYENKTDIPFVTSDTPVINLTGTEFADKNEFYYPISPSVAIKLCIARKTFENEVEENKQLIIKDRNEIEKLNECMIDNCYNEVFSNVYDALAEISDRYERKHSVFGSTPMEFGK